MILSEHQQVVVNSVDGIWAVLATAGSGKTTTLIERYKNMLMMGINNSYMLNLTFTSSAAESMVEKAGLLNVKSVFRTFHSFALMVLKAERQHIPFEMTEEIVPGFQEYQLLFDLADSYPAIKWRELKKRIENWKNNDILPDQAIEEEQNTKGPGYYLACGYRDYEKRCRDQGWLDFDDMIRETIILFESKPEVLARYRKDYLACDEAQDCDEKQFRLLQLLFKKNILIVGDENQCIFEWRSARPMNLTNFGQKFPGAKTLYLPENYRSTKLIVEFLKQITPIDNGLASQMITNNEVGVPPTITRYDDQESEASGVLRDILAGEPSKSVVIARTNRQLFTVQKACARLGIRYKNLGSKDFWQQNEVKKLIELAKKEDSNLPAHVVLTGLIQRHKLIEMFGGAATYDSDPVENLNDIVKMSANKGTTQEFLAYLKRLTYARKTKTGEALTLSTVHQGKGLEWDHVYLIGVNNDKMPHKNAPIPEERRVFFVGASRAAKTLNMSYYGMRSMFISDPAVLGLLEERDEIEEIA
jgi:superfamily I DNA/RNA helicase